MSDKRPRLVQINRIRPEDLSGSPVWAACHSFDYDEDWYDDTDEETFRPWEGPLPVDPMKGMFLVKSAVTLATGASLEGFLTPQRGSEPENLGVLQPHLFLPDRRPVGFWSGILGWDPELKRKFYELVGRTADEIFPIHFKACDGLALGRVESIVRGFYSRSNVRGVQFET